MPESSEDPPPKYVVESGISKATADEAGRQALIAYRNLEEHSHEPLQFLEHTEGSLTASNEFLKRHKDVKGLVSAEKTELVKLLKVHPSEVMKRYRGSHLCVCNDREKDWLQQSPRTDYKYSILALGDFSCINGLPKLGQEQKGFELKSGEVLHFRGDLDRHWKRDGGGVLLWFYWDAV